MDKCMTWLFSVPSHNSSCSLFLLVKGQDLGMVVHASTQKAGAGGSPRIKVNQSHVTEPGLPEPTPPLALSLRICISHTGVSRDKSNKSSQQRH